jgi:hypothetical protein
MTGETEEILEKPVPVTLWPLQIAHGQARARTRTSAVRGRRLKAIYIYIYIYSSPLFPKVCTVYSLIVAFLDRGQEDETF